MQLRVLDCITEREYHSHLNEVLSKNTQVAHQPPNPSPFLLLKESDDQVHFLFETVDPLV